MGSAFSNIRAVALALAGLCAVTVVLLAALLAVGTPSISESRLPNPLAPPATESPRATFSSLRREITSAKTLMRDTYTRHVAESGLFASQETEDQQAVIQAHLERATLCLDLSEVSPTNRRKIAIETVMLLGEIFDRVENPPASAIPDAETMKKSAEKGERQTWTFPGTEIRIARIDTGARTGEFLFTADTVARAYEFYKKIRSTPPAGNFDFYAFYSLSPGELVPPKWYSYVQKLPQWFHVIYIDSARWQWIALGLTLLLILAICLAVYRSTRPGRFLHRRLPRWSISLAVPLTALIAVWYGGAFIELLNFTGPVARSLALAMEIALYVPATWLAVVSCNRLADAIASGWGLDRHNFDTGILRVGIRLLGVLIAAGMLAYGANQIGVPLVGIVAGLGVGGLAMALAAQPTIENFIGGIMIYADRPVRVGDHGRFGDVTGVVEEIGIRSTRIRLPDRSITTIPNSDFSKSHLTNFSSRDRMLVNTTIGLAYGTKEEQLRDVLKRIAAELAAHPKVNPDNVSVRFAGFGGQSLEIEISAELANLTPAELAAAREDVLLRVFTIVGLSGGQLAGHG